jgi:hypothetical protein
MPDNPHKKCICLIPLPTTKNTCVRCGGCLRRRDAR